MNMNPFPGLEKFLNWLLNHSLQAGLLVLLVLLVQLIFRRQLTNRWRFALWWIVLIRLVLPFGPESSLSVFNGVNCYTRIEGPRYYLPPSAPLAHSKVEPSIPPTPLPAALPLTPRSTLAETPNDPLHASPASVASESARRAPLLNRLLGIPGRSINPNELVVPGSVALWALGTFALIGCVFVQLLRFQRKLRRDRMPTDPGVRELLLTCQREFGVTREIELLETEAVKSPALFGLFRLRLLLPKGMAGQFTQNELRFIFLHELAHVKRGDLWLNWLVTAMQIVHWFNPLIWIGFARLRADRELACDELALLRAGEKVGTSYGETVIKLLEGVSRPAAVPGLIGILEDKKQMRRRISMIANFRKPGRWSALAIVLVICVAAVALTDAQTEKPQGSHDNKAQTSQPAIANQQSTMEHSLFTPAGTKQPRPDLLGTVREKNGEPLAATIFISTAAPKVGTSTFCPSCYADCSKSAKTDADGSFKIESLDPQLTFNILVVTKGYKPKFVEKIDPAKGHASVQLEKMERIDAAPDRSLRGRVVNTKGKPVEGAVVEMVGIETKDGGGRYGSLPGVDPLAVSDENGEFLITAKDPFDKMDVKVTARTFADKPFKRLPSGKPVELIMTEGSTLTGRVVRDGKPLAGVSVGVSAVDRTAGNYLGHFEVSTGDRGDFAFVNLPPDADFHIYTLMNTMKDFGATPLRAIHTGKDGETTDVGDLVAQPAHRLAGRLALTDGEALPSGVRLLISRESAWDSIQITLDTNGYFNATGIPNEQLGLSARVKGYHVSARNRSVDQMNPYRLIGRVDRDATNLVFMLEKGPEPQPDYSHIDPEYSQLRERTLRGAEGPVDHSQEWSVAGRVIDVETKQPVRSFRVTPGQTDQFDRTAWNTLRAVDGTNGFFSTHISKRAAGQPMLKVEADDYLPAAIEIQSRDTTSADVTLKKGSGPSGTVVSPDGKPVPGAKVVLLGGEPNQANVNGKGELTTYGNRSADRNTGTNGFFSLKPALGMKAVAIGSSNGFVIVSLEALAKHGTVTLEPFGKIFGTLKRPSAPGTNETLDVTFAGESSGLNMWLPSETDAAGRFHFDHVPAGHLQISYRLPMGNNSWTQKPLKQVDLKPGETLEVNISAPDHVVTEERSHQPKPLTPMPGEHVKGVVLLPNGKPAAVAEVALQLTEGPFNLSLGRGTLQSSGLREAGLHLNIGKDGTFDFPLYEKAVAVVAANEEGFAQVSIDELKKSQRIQLQKWGRIEGTLRVGHHLGTNELVGLSAGYPRWNRKVIQPVGDTNSAITITNPAPAFLQPLMYDFQAFQARTDADGKFVFAFVPPGAGMLWRKIPGDGRSWTQSQLAAVTVHPGETVVTNIGGTGRTVVGKVHFNGDIQVDFKTTMGVITTPTFKIFEKARQLKTDAERRAFYGSPEMEKLQAEHRSFSVRIAEDGSFRAEDVLPGTYEFDFQPHTQDPKNHSWVTLASTKEFTVPAASDDDDSPVQWGTVELTKRELPLPDNKDTTK